MSQKIVLFDAEFILHCSGAIFWPARSILLISDVHLGKVSHFRRHGVALPEIFRHVLPFIGIPLGLLLVLIAFPAIATWLPRLAF